MKQIWILAVLLVLVMLCGTGSADSLVLRTGAGIYGEADPLNEWSADGGLTWHNAFIIHGHPTYDTLEQTHWINRTPSNGGPYFETTRYRVRFELPAGFEVPLLAIAVHADNVATIILNGVLIGSQPDVSDAITFQDPPEQFMADDPNLFRVGENQLVVDVFNYWGETGLDYEAIVTYDTGPTPSEPSSWSTLKGGWRSEN